MKGQVERVGESCEGQKGPKTPVILSWNVEMALEVMSINPQPSALFPLPLELPPLRGHPDAMSLEQGLGTVLTGQGRMQGLPALPGLHI